MIKLYENFINPKIDYYSNSQKKSEEWKVNGERHREDGPVFMGRLTFCFMVWKSSFICNYESQTITTNTPHSI